MREILFRGKRKDNGEWIEGFYVRLFEKENGFYKAKHYIFDGNTKLGEEKYCGHGNYEQDVKICKFEVIPDTVGQYTGLTDKNGKKIFEGDIIKTRRSGTRIEKLKGYYGYDSDGYPQKIPGYHGVSEYSYSCQIDCYAKVEYDPTNGGFYLNGGDMFVGAICNEVVGNIHDNPELLGAQ